MPERNSTLECTNTPRPPPSGTTEAEALRRAEQLDRRRQLHDVGRRRANLRARIRGVERLAAVRRAVAHCQRFNGKDARRLGTPVAGLDFAHSDAAPGHRIPAGCLDGAEVAEHVGGAVLGLQEAVAFLGRNHCTSAAIRCPGPASAGPARPIPDSAVVRPLPGTRAEDVVRGDAVERSTA